MKKQSKLLFLALVLGIVGCNSGQTTEPKSSELTAGMLSMLASGYSARGILSYEVYGITMSMQYVEVAATTNAYTYKGYEEVKDNPTLDVLKSSYRYAPVRLGVMSTTYLSEEELGFDNAIRNYPLVDSNGNYIAWSSCGYGNQFGKLKPGNFKNGTSDYEFVLDTSTKVNMAITSGIATQFCGMMGLTLSSFTITTDGYKPIKYDIEYAPISSFYGDAVYKVSGEFLEFGESVIPEIKLIEGTTFEEFDKTMEELRKFNFRASISKPSQTMEIESEDGKSLLYDVYNSKGQKTGSYGYYEPKTNVIQGLTKIGDNVYEDGDTLGGALTSALPSFAISSVFFNKSVESTADKAIYTYREDISKEIPLSTDYGMFSGSTVGDLTITIEKDAVTIKNKLRLGEEVFRYYDIGKVSGLLTNLKNNCDDLTWSQIASNQENDLNILYQDIPQEALDAIPTLGGKYSYIKLDVSSAPAAFIVPINDYSVASKAFNNYKEKLLANDFTLDESYVGTGELYLKTCTIDGKECQIGARIYLAMEFFYTPQLIIYPTML